MPIKSLTINSFVDKMLKLNIFRNKMNSFDILSRQQFHQRLERERSRSDRSKKSFSLIAFKNEVLAPPDSANKSLIKILKARLRMADEIGWFDKSQIGALLPDTPSYAALTIGEEICSRFSPHAHNLSFIVYVYPSDWFAIEVPDSKKEFISKDQHTSQYKLKDNISIPSASAEPYGAAPILTATVPANMPVKELRPFVYHHIPRWKHMLDIIGALIGIVLLAPLMILIALAIRLTSPGKIVFKQDRMGYGCIPFKMYKFRTMKENASNDPHSDYLSKLINGSEEANNNGTFKILNDNRITIVGRFLRKWSLDELPQLFNVLKGEMSLVGPRPELCYAYKHYIHWYHRRCLDSLPGITGIWQVEGRSRVNYEDMVRMDIKYGQTISLLNDIKIILRTFKAVFNHDGAH